MPTRNVVLTEHQQDMIDRLVQSGRYQDASDVLRDGLRLIEKREEREMAKLKALREAAAMGFSDIDEGRFVDVPMGEVDTYIAGLSREAGNKRNDLA
ncbi:antitoxin ParD1/3/4 [Rhizobium sp. RU35A]|uniref:Type II toxin-antitoxin system ParD family antitoxin n=1 Tax=Rhizobium straminoryzae TaxID=1387186 RepID=A0A549SPJ7_9HYPH|nr:MULTISPECIES: type II toxin-antitoxin system ParD family antitoxin [Rhizobium]TRL31539.1 type II toxin-antitoxin system ParD family antitoxin [Rhizobium straminoryzae]SIQ13544.1 antitoxin ParD1/3/4 [Rhizobium sp. RU35A]